MMRKVFNSMDIKKYLNVKFTQAEMFELSKSIRYCFRKKGDKVCTAGEKDNRLYFILRGKVKMSLPKQIQDGKTRKPGWAHAQKIKMRNQKLLEENQEDQDVEFDNEAIEGKSPLLNQNSKLKNQPVD